MEFTPPPSVNDHLDRPAQVRAVLAQWDISVDMLLERLEGVTDEEWHWEPGPGLRTLAWSGRHLGGLTLLRADWTTGSHSLTESTVEHVEGAAAGLAQMRRGFDAWRTTLVTVDDEHLDRVGGSAFPDGLDPHLPLIDIAWWNNRELIHHGADMATVRDLYAARS